MNAPVGGTRSKGVGTGVGAGGGIGESSLVRTDVSKNDRGSSFTWLNALARRELERGAVWGSEWVSVRLRVRGGVWYPDAGADPRGRLVLAVLAWYWSGEGSLISGKLDSAG